MGYVSTHDCIMLLCALNEKKEKNKNDKGNIVIFYLFLQPLVLPTQRVTDHALRIKG